MNADISVIKRYCGTQQKNVNVFLRQFVNNIASSSTNYCKQSLKQLGYMDNNLLATERGVYSLLSASVHAITPIHKSEMGVTRRVDRRRRENQDQSKTATGRVDLWCYKDGIEFFLEFKRTYISPENIIKLSVPGKIEVAWKTLTEQVNQVKGGVGKDLSYEGYESRTVFVGMHIITLRRTSKDRSKIDTALTECISPKKIRSWSEQLSRYTRSIDSIIEWKIGQNTHKFCEIDWDDDDEPTRWAAFPRHLFCFKIEFNKQAG